MATPIVPHPSVQPPCLEPDRAHRLPKTTGSSSSSRDFLVQLCLKQLFATYSWDQGNPAGQWLLVRLGPMQPGVKAN